MLRLLTAQVTPSALDPGTPCALLSPACFSEVSACEVTPVLGLNGRGRSVRENPLSADRTLVRSGRDAWPYGFGFEELRSHS